MRCPSVDPGSRLLDGERALSRDLEFDLHGELILGGNAIQTGEAGVYDLKHRVQIAEIRRRQYEFAISDLVRSSYDGEDAAVERVDQDLFRDRGRVGIRDEILTDLRVEVVVALSLVERIVRHGHAVCAFIAEVRMQQHAHRRGRVIDAEEIPLLECAKVPETRENLLDRFRKMSLIRLVGIRIV